MSIIERFLRAPAFEHVRRLASQHIKERKIAFARLVALTPVRRNHSNQSPVARRQRRGLNGGDAAQPEMPQAFRVL